MTCACTGAAAQAPLPGQDRPRAVFRTTTRLVTQTVVVKDKQGRPITGLTAADFVVTEDGQRQDVAFAEFQSVGGTADETAAAAAPVPIPARAGGPARAPISIPSPGTIGYRNHRLLVLYFDLSSMSPSDQARACSGARTYIDTQMAPSDLLAIMAFDGGAVRVPQDFTSDRDALRHVVQSLQSGNDQNGDGVADDPEQGSAFGENDAEFNLFNTDRQLAALQTAAAMLRPLPEQKSLIYFSGGVRMRGTDNRAQLRATVNAAVRANVTLNPVDARGLVALPPLGDATRASPGGIGMFAGTLADALQRRFERSQDTLYALARDTGGTALLDQNDLSLGIAQAARAVTSYYILGYYSTHTGADGRFRRVRVALRRGLSADLSYRDGYFADRAFAKFTAADKERQLEDALRDGNPITEIRIATEVNYFQLNRNEYFVPVSVRLPASELALARRRGAVRTVIDIIGEVRDDHGVAHRNVRDKLDIKVDEGTAASLSIRPLYYETGFTLLPGQYVLKILARDATTGRIGTFETPFEIPNLARADARLAISSVVLSSQRVGVGDALYRVRQKGADERANPLVHDGQRLVPSVTRAFRADRELYVFLQAYPSTPASLAAFVTFYSGDAKVLQTAPAVVTQPSRPGATVTDIRLSIPPGALAAGSYDCQVTVLDPDNAKAAFWRAPIALVR
ncbi:MAG: VWA domain-containing protein [Acidobacteria bacterium RIFCSPLOWO2_12_FULL_66_21]|nr:MAG: VWA domain-containing protein [Acidobacteria bacterium RIFCSPLOWO2_12_FULL_66_21]